MDCAASVLDSPTRSLRDLRSLLATMAPPHLERAGLDADRAERIAQSDADLHETVRALEEAYGRGTNLLFVGRLAPNKRIEDLMNVKGIGKKKFAKIAPACTVGR